MRIYLNDKQIAGPDVTWDDMCNPATVVTDEDPEAIFSVELMRQIDDAPIDGIMALGVNRTAISTALYKELRETNRLPTPPTIKSCEHDIERSASILYDEGGAPTLSQVRGGICFPTMIQLQGDEIGGFVALAGRDADGVVTVYEQQEYLVIDNILDGERRIKFKGIGGFFNDAWSRYFGRIFYWSQPFAMVKRYRLDIQYSTSIEPKPTLVEVDLAEGEDAYLSIWRLFHTRRLRMITGTPLHRAITLYKGSDNRKDIAPAIHALHCVLMGFDKIPHLTL